jgi:hypothetical protein
MHATIRVLPIIAAMLVMIADVSVSFVLAQSNSSVNGTNRTPAGSILSDQMQFQRRGRGRGLRCPARLGATG